MEAGASVTIEDPLYSDAELIAKKYRPGSIDGKIDAIVLQTAHPEFAEPNFSGWRALGVRAVLDGRAFWSREKAERAGLIYLGVGVGAITER